MIYLGINENDPLDLKLHFLFHPHRQLQLVIAVIIITIMVMFTNDLSADFVKYFMYTYLSPHHLPVENKFFDGRDIF